MSLTHQDWHRAMDAGETARRAGKPITACPNYDLTATGRAKREAWEDGWTRADQRIKSQAASA